MDFNRYSNDLHDFNPGALTVLEKIEENSKALKNPPATLYNFFNLLRERKIVGPTLWVAYKDVCNFDAVELKRSIVNNDEKFMKKLEKKMKPVNLNNAFFNDGPINKVQFNMQQCSCPVCNHEFNTQIDTIVQCPECNQHFVV